MRIRVFQIFALLFAFATLLPCPEADAQAAAEIENVIRNSKWVDKTRPVRAQVGARETTVSTYSHRKASDQDCKINSLFIMKELAQHFKTIHRLHICFFDPINPDHFRAVDVSEGDVSLVDGGKPVQEVLSQLNLTRGKLQKQQSAATAQSSTLNKSAALSPQGPPRLAYVVSNDGDVSLLLPEQSYTTTRPSGATLIMSTSQLAQITLMRHDIGTGSTFDDVVRSCELTVCLGLKGWHKLKEEQQSVKSLAAIYEEGTFDPGYKMRMMFIHGRSHMYLVTVMSTLKNEGQMQSILPQIISSINIKG